MKVIATGLFALYLVAPGAAFAASIEALQGAWAMDGTDCAAVFEKKGNEIHFAIPARAWTPAS